MKSALSLCLAAVLPLSALFAAQSSGGMISANYDKFDDLTEVSTIASIVSNAMGRKQDKQDLRLQVLYECPGDTSHCRPDNVKFRFVSYSVGEYTGSDQLTFIVDGKRIRLSLRWSGQYEGRKPVEYLTAGGNLEEFLSVVNAEKVEGRLGGTTFTLSDDNLTAIRALADEIGLTASKEKS